MVYFDNAASSFPKPYNVSKLVGSWIYRNGANPGRSGHLLSIEASEIVYETRQRLADFFGIDNCERIVFVPSATLGLNMLIQGLLSEGDHAVTTDLEHNSVLRPLQLLTAKNVTFDVAKVDLNNDDVTVKNIVSLINRNTKVVVCTQCSNVCGKIMPVKAISDALPDRVKLVVDGSQGAGIIPTNITSSGIDYYCAPSHKGLMGPQGSGFIAILSDMPAPLIAGGTGSESFSLYQPDYLPDALESGTLSTPAIVGLNEGIKFIQSIGINKVYRHKQTLTEYLYSSLDEIDGIIKYVNYERDKFIGCVCFNLNDCTSDELSMYLSDNGICVRSGIHCAPLFHKKMNTERSGMVRVSFGYYNRVSEIDFFVKKLKKYLKK